MKNIIDFINEQLVVESEVKSEADFKEYAEKKRIEGLLGKYCKFMPVPVIFGKEQEWKDGKYVDTDKDNVINRTEPLWARKPADLTEEDYKAAERELAGKEKNKPVRRDPDAPRNPNVRSLHHIDDEDYESPAEREARLAARKRDYVEEDETPKQKTSDNAYSEGVTLKEDDRPARKDKSKKDSED